jgi:hypothetical protein
VQYPHGVHIGDSGAKPLPARKGLTGLRLCVTGEFRACDVRDMSVHPDFGAARCADRTCTAGDGRREERSQTGSLVVRRSPRPRQPFQPITTCEHFPGGQALTTRAYGEEGLRARGRHPGGWRRVVHSPVHY